MKETLKLALEALHGFIPYLPLKDKEQCEKYDKAITAIKAALAQLEGQSNFCAQCEAFARELKAVKQAAVAQPAHVISEQEQLKQWIEMTKYYRAKREYEPDAAQPAQEPVEWVDLLKQAEKVVRSKPLWKKYIDGTPLANDIPVWMASFAQQHTTPQQRPWVGLTDEDFYGQSELQRLAMKYAEAKLKKNT